MNNKKLIFVLGAERSGSTLLLSYLCGIPNTKVLYETKLLSTRTDTLEKLADYFDSFEEEIVVEKTPCHALYLEDIEKLRELCSRDIYVIYIVRPPVLTILSLLKASKDSVEVWGTMSLLGACEKYEESLVSIYNHLILKSNKPNKYKKLSCVQTYNTQGELVVVDDYLVSIKYIPYSYPINYRELIENPYKVVDSLLNDLSIAANTQSLIDNRISNAQEYLLSVVNENYHTNVLRDIEEVELERRVKISRQIKEGFSDNYIEKSNYIRNYFEHPITKETIYDLVVNKKILKIETYPLVTIIVPLYNKESYVEETLISLLTQTYQNIRVVVIDDASTDKSLEVVEKYFESLPQKLQDKLWIIRGEHNLGVSFTRNIGLAGYADIFSFCDADDIWDKTLVEKSVNTFTKYPYVDCVYSRVLHKRGDLLEKDSSKICNGYVFKDAINSNILNCGSNLFVKAKYLNENKISFDESITNVEDWEFLLHLALTGAVFKCTKEYLVTYRQTPDSVTKNRVKQLQCSKTILDRYLFLKVNGLTTLEKKKMFYDSFTRRFCFYFSFKNMTYDHLKDLDYSFIIRVVVNKFKSFVKSYIS